MTTITNTIKKMKFDNYDYNFILGLLTSPGDKFYEENHVLLFNHEDQIIFYYQGDQSHLVALKFDSSRLKSFDTTDNVKLPAKIRYDLISDVSSRTATNQMIDRFKNSSELSAILALDEKYMTATIHTSTYKINYKYTLTKFIDEDIDENLVNEIALGKLTDYPFVTKIRHNELQTFLNSFIHLKKNKEIQLQISNTSSNMLLSTADSYSFLEVENISTSENTSFETTSQYTFSSLATICLILGKKYILDKCKSVTLSFMQNSFIKIVFDFGYAELVFFTSPLETEEH